MRRLYGICEPSQHAQNSASAPALKLGDHRRELRDWRGSEDCAPPADYNSDFDDPWHALVFMQEVAREGIYWKAIDGALLHESNLPMPFGSVDGYLERSRRHTLTPCFAELRRAVAAQLDNDR